MTDKTFNGWTNRATWLVNVWFEPLNLADVRMARETIEEDAENLPRYLKDFLCTDEINWTELEDYAMDIEDEEDED